jgi:hypothetical protein
MSTLISLFGSLLLLGLTAGGLLLIVAPDLGRKLLKKVGIAAGLFLLGVALLQVSCSALRG